MTEIVNTIPKAFAPLLQPYRYKVFYGGRGSGKSINFARILLSLALQKKMRILCTREIQRSIRDSSHRILSDQIQELKLGAYFEVTQNEIRCLRTGSQFLFSGLATNTVESIKSFAGIDIVWVDEAQAVSARSWEVLIPTIREDKSEIWISFNPYLMNDPVYERFVLKPAPPDSYVRKINFDENPFFPNTLRKEMEEMEKNDHDKYLHVYGGECIQHSNAIVFKGKYKIQDFIPDEKLWDVYYGADWGFSPDPTCLIKCRVYERILYIEEEVYALEQSPDMIPALFDGISGARNSIIRGDSSRRDIILLLKRNGFTKFTPCRKWPGSVLAGIDFMKLSFDQIIIHPNCKHIIEEFAHYSYKENKHLDEKDPYRITPDVIDLWNHGIDSVRYALEPLIMGHAKKIPDGPEPTEFDQLGNPIHPTMNRFLNPNAWMA